LADSLQGLNVVKEEEITGLLAKTDD